jgi:hypothetical protein
VVQENEEMHEVLLQQNEKLALFVDQKQYLRRKTKDEMETQQSLPVVSFQKIPFLMENEKEDDRYHQNPSQSHVQPTVLPQAERKYRNPNNPSPNSNPNPNSGKLAPAFSPTVSVYDGRRLEGKLQVPSLQVKKQLLSEGNLEILPSVNGDETESALISPIMTVAATDHSYSNGHSQNQLVNGSGGIHQKTFNDGNGRLQLDNHQEHRPPHLEKTVDWSSNKLKFQALLKKFEKNSE